MINDGDLNDILDALIEKCKNGDVSAIRVLLDFNRKCREESEGGAVNLVINDDYGEEDNGETD